jgi:hypothetical protein
VIYIVICNSFSQNDKQAERAAGYWRKSKISYRKMALQIERNRENKEQLISFVFGFNLPVTIFDILPYNKWFKTNCKL